MPESLLKKTKDMPLDAKQKERLVNHDDGFEMIKYQNKEMINTSAEVLLLKPPLARLMAIK